MNQAELRAVLLNQLQFFTRDARVIFQLAPRDARHSQSIMVGELRAALGEDLEQARKDDLTAGDSLPRLRQQLEKPDYFAEENDEA